MNNYSRFELEEIIADGIASGMQKSRRIAAKRRNDRIMELISVAVFVSAGIMLSIIVGAING